MNDLIGQRLATQLLVSPAAATPAEIVAHFAAMQAQDLAMVKWAVGIRSTNLTVSDIDQAFASGAIVRTHALRPTWHLIANEDVDWLLKLTTPQILTTMRSRHKQLGLDTSVIQRARKLVTAALAAIPYLNRKGTIATLKKGKLELPNECYSHIFLHLELDRVLCSGPIAGSETSYALYERVIKKPTDIPRDEALQRLAVRYFQAHGPATLEDFVWWSGLKIKDARAAISAAGVKSFDKTSQLLTLRTRQTIGRNTDVVLLPAFDEYIIGYADRSAVLGKDTSAKVISSNGIFRPVILRAGMVYGLWKRELTREGMKLLPNLVRGKTAVSKKALATAFERYARFHKSSAI